MDTYHRLVRLYTECAAKLNAANIKFWLNYGTLLGWYRSNSIIPWDYDCDLCLLKEDYEKAKVALSDGLCADFYNDDNCMVYFGAGSTKEYHVASAQKWDIGIDLVAYGITEERCTPNIPLDGDLFRVGADYSKLFVRKTMKCLMSEKTRTEYSSCVYDYPYEDIMPLREVVFCGDKALVPNKTKKILEEQYGDLGVPSDIDESKYPAPLSTTNVVCVGKVIKNCPIPYVIRNFASILLPDKETLYAAFVKEKEIYGYGYVNETDYIDVNAGVLNEWQNLAPGKSMSVKLLDCWCTNDQLTPAVILDNATYPGKNENKYHLNYILTGCGLTKFHMDPGYGGGWMYLYSGQKLWWFIDPKSCKSYSGGAMGYDKNPEISKEELEYLKTADLVDLFTQGYTVYTCLAGKDDFIVFPQGWLHRVYTYEKSIGCGGYL